MEAAEPFHLVGLMTGGDVIRPVAFAAAVQLGGYELVVKDYSGWAAVDDAAYGHAVGFAEGAQPESVAKGVHVLECLNNRLEVRGMCEFVNSLIFDSSATNTF